MKPTIVVVENNLFTAREIQKILEGEGFLVIIDVVTIYHAIKLIDEHNPILVLININLNDEKDGIHLGHFLFKKRTIPYIYISSFSDEFTLNRVKETRPHGFIAKPFKKVDILATVLIVLNHFKPFCADSNFITNVVYDEIPIVLKEIILYIDDNINKKITIYDLSIKSRWKQQHFIRVFTNHMGVTPYQYILLKKIEKAKKLISETDINIVDIAFELGFLSYTNFSNAFKKTTGKTPSNYRLNFGMVS